MRCPIACEIAHETEEDGKRWRNFSWLWLIRKEVKNSTIDSLGFPPTSLIGFVPALSAQISFKDPSRTMGKTLRENSPWDHHFLGYSHFHCSSNQQNYCWTLHIEGHMKATCSPIKLLGKFAMAKGPLYDFPPFCFIYRSCLARRGCARLEAETPELLGDKGKEREQKVEMRVKHQRQPHSGMPVGN